MKILPIIICAMSLLLSTACINIEEDGQPQANAGPDKVVLVDESNIVKLSAEASFDPNGDPLVYHWSIESLPAGSHAELSSYSTMEVNLPLDVFGEYKIGLVVDDGISASRKDIVTIRYQQYLSEGEEGDANFSGSSFNHNTLMPSDRCDKCHLTQGTHIISTNACDACHATTTWTPVIHVDHFEVIGLCADCHNGSVAVGKQTAHFTTTDNCENCHTTISWRTETIVDHREAVGDCSSCHDGIIAVGQSVTHIDTNNECNVCHNTIAWLPTRDSVDDSNPSGGVNLVFSHIGIVDNCANCHNGLIAGGKSKNHISTNAQCSSCHTVGAWVPAIFDHLATVGTCIDCHNGLYATGKFPAHIITTDLCEACHSTGMWIPAITVDHEQVIGNCASCHNGTVAGGSSTLESHIASTDVCEACHSTTMWTPIIRIDHAQVLGTCETCHAPPADHQAIGVTASCDDCHNAESWLDPIQPLPAPAVVNSVQ